MNFPPTRRVSFSYSVISRLVLEEWFALLPDYTLTASTLLSPTGFSSTIPAVRLPSAVRRSSSNNLLRHGLKYQYCGFLISERLETLTHFVIVVRVEILLDTQLSRD